MLWFQLNIWGHVSCCLNLNENRLYRWLFWASYFRAVFRFMPNKPFRAVAFAFFVACRTCVALTGICMPAYSLRLYSVGVSEIFESNHHIDVHICDERKIIYSSDLRRVRIRCVAFAISAKILRAKNSPANDTNRRFKRETNGRNSCKKVDFFATWILTWSTRRISFQSCMHFQAWLTFAIFDYKFFPRNFNDIDPNSEAKFGAKNRNIPNKNETNKCSCSVGLWIVGNQSGLSTQHITIQAYCVLL